MKPVVMAAAIAGAFVLSGCDTGSLAMRQDTNSLHHGVSGRLAPAPGGLSAVSMKDDSGTLVFSDRARAMITAYAH